MEYPQPSSGITDKSNSLGSSAPESLTAPQPDLNSSTQTLMSGAQDYLNEAHFGPNGSAKKAAGGAQASSNVVPGTGGQVLSQRWLRWPQLRLRLPRQPQRLVPFLLRYQLAIVMGIILVVLLKEAVEILLVWKLEIRWHLIYDLVLYVLILPLLWVGFKLLERSETERQQIVQDRDFQTALGQALGEAHSWDELVCRIVEYPHQVTPQAKVTLYVYQPASMHLAPEATCGRDGEVVIQPKINMSPDSLPIGSLPQLLLQNDFIPTRSTGGGAAQRFDLPVAHNDRQIGVLKLEYPLGSGPTADQIRALKTAIPVIALALEAAQLQKLAVEQAAASEAERQQIAQNLHDSLAQNISYLRLKLDQLTGENAIQEIGGVLQELERMRTTADEAYQQVRNTLEELNPVNSEDLATIVINQARMISQRAGFTLNTTQLGAAHLLPAATRQQVLYIVREALHNVEKHARANQVTLQFLWLESELIVKIADNGVGFNPMMINLDGHYGLRIMQHRAHEIGGTLNIIPADNGEAGATGTEVTLWVPQPAHSLGQPG